MKLKLSAFVFLLFLVVGGEVKGMDFWKVFGAKSKQENAESPKSNLNLLNTNNESDKTKFLKKQEAQYARENLLTLAKKKSVGYLAIRCFDTEPLFEIFPQNSWFNQLLNGSTVSKTMDKENLKSELKACPLCITQQSTNTNYQTKGCSKCRLLFTFDSLENNLLLLKKKGSLADKVLLLKVKKDSSLKTFPFISKRNIRYVDQKAKKTLKEQKYNQYYHIYIPKPGWIATFKIVGVLAVFLKALTTRASGLLPLLTLLKLFVT